MNLTRTIQTSGKLSTRIGVVKDNDFFVLVRVPWWKWMIKQRPRFIWHWAKGHLTVPLGRWFVKHLGGVYVDSELRLRIFDRERRLCFDLGVVNKNRVVTDALIALLVDALDTGATPALDLFNFGGFGSGATSETAAQTALVTEFTTEYAVDSTRPTGTITQPSASQYRIVATLTPDANVTVNEFSPFSQAATGGGSMMDRSLTGAQVINSGNSIESTFTLSFTSGG